MPRFCRLMSTASDETLPPTLQSQDGAVASYTNSMVYKEFKPLLTSMLLCGLHHSKYSTCSSTWRLWLSRLYCWAVTLSLTVVTVLNIASLRSITNVDSGLFTLLTSCSTYGLIASNAFSFILAAHHRKALEKFFTCFACLDLYGGPYVTRNWLKKFLNGTCIASWVSVGLGMVFVSLFMSQGMYSVIISPSDVQSKNATSVSIAQAVSIAYMVYPVACWVFTTCLELALALVINRELSLFARTLKSKYVSGNGNFVQSNEVEKDRRRFLEMTRIIKAADCSLAVHQVASFGFNIASICLQVYNICYYPELKENFGSYFTFGLFMYASDVGTVYASGILVTIGVCCVNVSKI